MRLAVSFAGCLLALLFLGAARARKPATDRLGLFSGKQDPPAPPTETPVPVGPYARKNGIDESSSGAKDIIVAALNLVSNLSYALLWG